MFEDVEIVILTDEDKKNKTSPNCSSKFVNLFTLYGQ